MKFAVLIGLPRLNGTLLDFSWLLILNFFRGVLEINQGQGNQLVNISGNPVFA